MEEFLHWLFGPAMSSQQRLAIFTLPGHRCEFFADVPSATRYARSKQAAQDVYFGVSLVGGNPRGRGKSTDMAGIGAVWADIDFAGPAHPGKALPANDHDLARLLAELPLAPSVIVDSGHGRHLYWLMHEPWVFADPAERGEAARLCQGWHELVCQAGRRLGWSFENLGDLARILRLPGTVNHKQVDTPIGVRVLEAHPERRYDRDDFEPFLPESLPPVAKPAPVSQSPVSFAEPPADKLAAALAESAVFAQTWQRARADLADQSASAYDLSLATLAALRGWSDAEIASLLFAWRTEQGENPGKLQRADYLARTLRRAREAAQEDQTPVDLSAFQVGPPVALHDEPPPPDYPDPGPLPESLCRIPGFVSEVMDHCLATAPYPNVPLAFCGAMALQALLAGRKVRDEADNRTNLYLLALAYSAGGKDWPRKLNVAILHQVGLVDSLGDKFASGEGIQDALFLRPAMLFQNDEIDGLLQSISKSRDARYENILGTLLTMYSSANSVYPMRRKAGKESPGVIDQPCLVMFGTAIPTHYYSALSERMLSNGFFARMLIVESGRRGVGQEPGLIDPTASILETARWWAEFSPGTGNLETWHPKPVIVPATESARELLREARVAAEREYSLAETRGDAVGTTVWGRVHEQTRKLALLYAVSANHCAPRIDESAVQWATAFVLHQTRRMLFMAHGHVAENPFHGECLKLINKLREAPGYRLAHSVLLKRMKLDTQTFQKLIATLEEQGDVRSIAVKTVGRPALHYLLARELFPRGETTGDTNPTPPGEGCPPNEEERGRKG